MSNFHEKLMGFNEAMKIRKCNIHGPEKRFMGFSEVFHGIFMNLQLVVEIYFFLVKFMNSTAEYMNQKCQVFQFLIQGALREFISHDSCQIWSNHSGNKVT